VARLAHHFGPTYLYIFSPQHLERELRDLAIVAEYDHTFDGANGINALARRHRLSAAQVYAILRAARSC
jgi:Mor family transcriptional regulator